MDIQNVVPRKERNQRIVELMETVGLQRHQLTATHMNFQVVSVNVLGLRGFIS